MRERIERFCCAIILLAALGMTLTGCGGNQATETGWRDHNLDGYEDGGM